MEKTALASNFNRWSNIRTGAFLALMAVALSPCGGCYHSRIVLKDHVGSMSDWTTGEALNVVEFTSETRADIPLAIPLPGGVYVQEIPSFQQELQKVCPERFSSGEDAVPVVIRLRASLEDWDPAWAFFLPAATLVTIPSCMSRSVRFEAEVQLDIGKWSDPRMVQGSEQIVAFNPISECLFAWLLPQEKGWQEYDSSWTGKPGHLLPNNHRLQFSMMEYLMGKDGANAKLTREIAMMIARAWDELPPAEKRAARNNLVAQKKYEERYGPVVPAGRREIVPVPVPTQPENAVPREKPRILNKEYNPKTRIGFVEFTPGDAGHLRVAKHIREKVIPPLIDKGEKIRILREGTEGEGVFRIEFEVVQ